MAGMVSTSAVRILSLKSSRGLLVCQKKIKIEVCLLVDYGQNSCLATAATDEVSGSYDLNCVLSNLCGQGCSRRL